MSFTTEELGAVAILHGLPVSHLVWLAAWRPDSACPRRAHVRVRAAGGLFIVVTGTIEGYEQVGGEALLVATIRAGQVTGMLPYSRTTHYLRYTVAVEAAQVCV